jgi:hypothetical protein
LYEMLVGTRPFAGEDVSETVARVIEREPDWSALAEAAPPLVVRVVRRCLQKDVHNRFRDIGDARLDQPAWAIRKFVGRHLQGGRSWRSRAAQAVGVLVDAIPPAVMGPVRRR